MTSVNNVSTLRGVAGRSLVAVANERVSIVAVCREVGMSVPDTAAEGRSVKVHCPFGAIYHADNGLEPAFRVYPGTNSAYCFAGCGFFSPVWLYAQANDLSSQDSAVALLDTIGYKPLDHAQAWAKATASVVKIDQSALSEALKVYCSRLDPGWEEHQYDPAVARTLSRCLELLPRVRTGEEAREWLEATKSIMARTLEGTPDGARA